MTQMQRDKEALRLSIEQNEARLKEALGTLTHSIKSEVRVGPRMAKSPYRALGVALAIGFVIGILPHGPALPNPLD